MPDPNKPDAPGLHIDSDWKAQAQAEKQKLAEETRDTGAAHGQLPPADFNTLLQQLASQALLYMGVIPDPMTGQRIAHLDLAKLHIDLLGVLEKKTDGNLSDDESKLLTQALSELRAAYVELNKQFAAQQARKAAGAPGSIPGATGPKPGPGLIDPTK
ncbi:MAG: DUF1844 domain-containing protein [Planctomycetes bacterium]|nr:DUF1844 domain-containing protein [Planctomycetota bacterium]